MENVQTSEIVKKVDALVEELRAMEASKEVGIVILMCSPSEEDPENSSRQTLFSTGCGWRIGAALENLLDTQDPDIRQLLSIAMAHITMKRLTGRD